MQKACKKTCDSEELHCLMLDDNGYVIVSDNIQETGMFFGKVRPDIMSQLIDESIYRVHRMIDYQGLCPEGQDSGNAGSRLLSVSKFTIQRYQILIKYILAVFVLYGGVRMGVCHSYCAD